MEDDFQATQQNADTNGYEKLKYEQLNYTACLPTKDEGLNHLDVIIKQHQQITEPHLYN